MTLSIWRLSHLCLTLLASGFLLIASITGAMLTLEPIKNQSSPAHPGNLSSIRITEFISTLQENYLEVIDIKIDKNEFVQVAVITNDGDFSEFYIDPISFKKIGDIEKKSEFFEFNRSLHRSLFMGEAGRLLIGISSFLLILIAISGIALLLKQLTLKGFFSRVEVSSFAQRWHIRTGRLSLIIILIIGITGSLMSLDRFELTPQKKEAKHIIKPEKLVDEPFKTINEFSALQTVKLNEVELILFPFSPDKEDYFQITLHDRDLLVNQFTGELINEYSFGKWNSLSSLSYNLHTGKGSTTWSVVLFIGCLNILFFIYSGFRIFITRKKGVVKNKMRIENAETVILFGSENGTSKYVAAQLFKALRKNNGSIYIDDLDAYKEYKSLKRLIIITSTYGEGEAPSNAKKFIARFIANPPEHDFQFTVVGFGSHYYPKFCQFAKDVHSEIVVCSKAKILLPLETIHDQSYVQFQNWYDTFQERIGESATLKLSPQKRKVHSSQIIRNIALTRDKNESFLLQLKQKRFVRFKSGDLLAIAPNNDATERFYSIARINREILVSIRKHEFGTCSNYLSSQTKGKSIPTRIIRNSKFHLPRNKNVICIANGTGIAPFLGMAQEKRNSRAFYLFWGGKSKKSLELYEGYLPTLTGINAISGAQYAFSQDPIETKRYVQDLLIQDGQFIRKSLEDSFVILICGSVDMQKDVLKTLENIMKESDKTLLKCQQEGQIMVDCY